MMKNNIVDCECETTCYICGVEGCICQKEANALEIKRTVKDIIAETLLWIALFLLIALLVFGCGPAKEYGVVTEVNGFCCAEGCEVVIQLRHHKGDAVSYDISMVADCHKYNPGDTVWLVKHK